MARKDITQHILPVEVDLDRERAGGLGRSGRKLEEALAEAHRLHASLAGLTGEARTRAERAYAAAHREAEHLLWCLKVQREAIGLRSHRDVDELYPLPPRLH